MSPSSFSTPLSNSWDADPATRERLVRVSSVWTSAWEEQETLGERPGHAAWRLGQLHLRRSPRTARTADGQWHCRGSSRSARTATPRLPEAHPDPAKSSELWCSRLVVVVDRARTGRALASDADKEFPADGLDRSLAASSNRASNPMADSIEVATKAWTENSCKCPTEERSRSSCEAWSSSAVRELTERSGKPSPPLGSARLLWPMLSTTPWPR